jgi:hypothetical protein
MDLPEDIVMPNERRSEILKNYCPKTPEWHLLNQIICIPMLKQ